MSRNLQRDAMGRNERPRPAAVVARQQNFGVTKFTRIVTTSWDEGSPFDLRVAKLLAARKVAGTFYVPVKGRHRSSRMGFGEIFDLDQQRFEGGAFGVSHPDLCACDPNQLTMEIEGCKSRLEDDLVKKVSMFAYPQGRHNNEVIASLKSAGYVGARTTAMLDRGLSFDPFRMPTSVRVFPHSRLDYLRNLAGVWNAKRTWSYALHFRHANNWIELAKLIFDSVLHDGGVWHLYGHSWEIEELRLWDGLKEVLDYVSGRPDVLYLANSSVVKLRAAKFVGTQCYAETTAT